MPTGLLDDELWKLIEPLVPARKRRFHHPGRKRLDDRRTLSGILFVLRTGIAWQQLPQELGRACPVARAPSDISDMTGLQSG